jgi:uncharacterized protein YndB with AHSA1/START domain
MSLKTSRRFAHSPAEIWAAIADPAKLAQWWGPRGFTNTFSRFEFRPGGAWSLVMHGPDGASYPNEILFAALDAPRYVLIRHIGEPWFSLSIDLRAQDDGTLLLWEQRFDDEAVEQAVAAICTPANEDNLDRLQAVLAQASIV